MNERIRELLNEATVGLEPDLSPQRTVTLNELEKFAELIVKECADIVLNGRAKEDEPWDHSFWNQACENRAYAIKHHFGVEE